MTVSDLKRVLALNVTAIYYDRRENTFIDICNLTRKQYQEFLKRRIYLVTNGDKTSTLKIYLF